MTDDDLERLHTGILTQHEAAISHLNLAYRLYMAGEYGSAATLAGAAEEILADVASKIGVSQMKSGLELLKARTGMSGRKLNEVRNWLKHPEDLDRYRGEVFHAAVHMMIRALNNYIACSASAADTSSSVQEAMARMDDVWARFEEVESRLQQQRPQGAAT